MNINMIQIKRQIRNRKVQKFYEEKPIGSAIKFRRREMHMTLEEGAEGICSISYLSKLENNLIEPGNKFINALMERFGLEDTIDLDYNQYLTHLNLLINHMLKHTKPDEDITLYYGKRKDYQALLVRMSYHTLFQHYDLAMTSYHDLRLYIPNLSRDEFALFLILVGMYLNQEHQYSEAYELLLLAPPFEHLQEQISLMLLKWRLSNAFQMHKISEILNNYPEYVNKVIDSEHYHLLQEIRKEYMRFEAVYQHPDEIEKSLDKMHTLNPSEKDYLKAKSLFHHQRYEQVITLSTSYYKLDSNWLILHMLSLDYMKKNQELKDVLANIEDIKYLCKTSKILIAHLRHKHKSDKTQLLNYLRREILGIRHLTDEYHVLDYLMTDAQNLFSTHQHYKEAVQVTTHYLPRLKGLRRADPIYVQEE